MTTEERFHAKIQLVFSWPITRQDIGDYVATPNRSRWLPTSFRSPRLIVFNKASANNRTPHGSLLHRKTCGVRFILHVLKGPGCGLHVRMVLRPP